MRFCRHCYLIWDDTMPAHSLAFMHIAASFRPKKVNQFHSWFLKRPGTLFGARFCWVFSWIQRQKKTLFLGCSWPMPHHTVTSTLLGAFTSDRIIGGRTPFVHRSLFGGGGSTRSEGQAFRLFCRRINEYHPNPLKYNESGQADREGIQWSMLLLSCHWDSQPT